ncbi:D-alanyl-D-alanine carboxypeptidase/D-alanyl-D-alanine endopeptidase [Pedobacter glucosidilyticus]|uniref:D-alanyl-D-alanine carboxypeptidase/D-alanyl-D-alanine endopeptidase n=1 Tax=Pedobacter glucosidilyticus TaxID=1122941 RepID=UPI0003FD080B|nr:D-alanyl-D-alanine carboxypeptidase/D-alanyl-D-alanine-endopeptidase [Pedobacter glucosidilyticus]
MKNILLALSIFFLCSNGYSQTQNQKIQVAYQKFIADEQLKHASVSFTVTNVANGSSIFSAQPQLGMVPGSTLKVITAATALSVLGENYRFKTEIGYQGVLNNGVLQGNIIIKGSGDPTLGSDRYASTTKTVIYAKILDALKQAGIKKITGEIIADDAVWDSQSLPDGWIWQDMGNYYGASTSAVCWGENEFDVNFNPSTVLGKPVTIINEKQIYPFLTLVNEVGTGAAGSGDQVYGYSSPYSDFIYLRGTYAQNLKKTIRFALPDAALAMAYDVHDFLNQNDIQTSGFNTTRKLQLQSVAVKGIQNSLMMIESPKLSDIIYQFNQKSLNLYGEQLLRVMSTDNSILKGLTFIKNFWKNKGIVSESLNMYDASGLSPANRVTSKTMVDVLLAAKKEKWFNAYLNSFPVYNNMKMKSGTIGDVLCYAGYHEDKCFSIMVNNYSGSTSTIRQKIFTLLNSIK